ncbi:kinase-associated lipoprotein B [Paenibacillus sp. MMO-177]|uniref:kinase-associated lipoprotein B n=1 Tax=Paenibacillus sp. MMO-177 TaxID=3081289 RepID=UPI003018F0D5
MQENRDFIVPGALAKADVRSGQYIGEIVEVNGPRAVFKVLAVIKHPEQGDLHHPYNPDVAMFHERRALAYTEKTNVMLRDLKPFEGEVPDYNVSLQEAVAAQIAALDRLMRWSARGLEILKELRKEYK